MSEKGTLYLVATPIGNLGDWSLRAETVLGKVALVAAEDTRVTRKLLAAKGISAKLASYYEGAEEQKSRRKILDTLESGQDVALVSDAGSPGISDPGYPLVKDAVDLGIKIVPIPGPSAVITALQMAACPTDRFAFFGFLPRKGKARALTLDQMESWNSTCVLYESPKRISATLKDLANRFPKANGAICREITKLYEEAVRGTMEELATMYEGRTVKGEVVIVLDVAVKGDVDEADIIRKAMSSKKMFNLSDKDAAGIASVFSGVSKNRIYKGLLSEKEKE